MTSKVYSQPINANIQSKGQADYLSKTINWEVSIFSDSDLTGYRFYNDLSTVEAYVKDSFEVNDIKIAPSYNSNVIEYMLNGNEVKIKFKTRLENWELSGNEELLKKENTFAVVDKNNNQINKSISSVDVDKLANHIVANNEDNEIEWSIVFNPQNKQGFKNVVIEDVLQKSELQFGIKRYGLEFVSANLAKWDGISSSISSEPTGSKYFVGDVDGKVTLTIKSRLTEELPDSQVYYRFKNTARILWDGVSTPLDVTAYTLKGARSLNLSAVNENGEDTKYVTPEISWKIKVPLGTITSDTKVYDMIIFDSSVPNVNLSTNITLDSPLPSGIPISSLAPADLRHHRYIQNSFSADNGVTFKSYKILNSGEYVGDLLEFSDLDKANTSSDSVTINFKTKIEDPRTLINSGEQKIYNTAKLVKANKVIDYDSYETIYLSRMIELSSLQSDSSKIFKNSLSSDIANTAIKQSKDFLKANSFDQDTNSIIFRLSINPNDVKNLKFNSESIILKDTLPEGWEVGEIVPGKKFVVFRGEAVSQILQSDSDEVKKQKVSNSQVRAIGNIVDNPELSVDFIDNVATFNFNDLNSPYVLLFEARPKMETVSDYLKYKQTITNTAQFSVKKKNAGTFKVEKNQKVDVKGNILAKKYNKIENRILSWIIDYRPYDITFNNDVYLEELLDKELVIRTTSDDMPIFDGTNFKLYETSISLDGEENIIGEVHNLSDYLSYEKSTNKLVLNIPDKSKSYRFIYITELNGEVGKEVGNTVHLFGEAGFDFYAVPKKYIIQNDDIIKITDNFSQVQSTTSASLQITNALSGTGANYSDEFRFSIRFDRELYNQYVYEKNGIYSGTIKSGDSFVLSGGQNIVIRDIDEGVRYVIEETDYKDYSPDYTVIEGQITTDKSLHVQVFTNTRNTTTVTTSTTLDITNEQDDDMNDVDNNPTVVEKNSPSKDDTVITHPSGDSENNNIIGDNPKESRPTTNSSSNDKNIKDNSNRSRPVADSSPNGKIIKYNPNGNRPATDSSSNDRDKIGKVSSKNTNNNVQSKDNNLKNFVNCYCSDYSNCKIKKYILNITKATPDKKTQEQISRTKIKVNPKNHKNKKDVKCSKKLKRFIELNNDCTQRFIINYKLQKMQIIKPSSNKSAIDTTSKQDNVSHSDIGTNSVAVKNKRYI